MIWTTDLQTSQRIKELVGEQKTYMSHWNIVGTKENCFYKMVGTYNDVKCNGLDQENLCPAFTLSELAPVLKKIGEMNKFPLVGWYGENYDNEHYLKICELVGTGQEKEVNQYLLELMK